MQQVIDTISYSILSGISLYMIYYGYQILGNRVVYTPWTRTHLLMFWMIPCLALNLSSGLTESLPSWILMGSLVVIVIAMGFNRLHRYEISVYNLERQELESLLTQGLASRHLPFERNGSEILLSQGKAKIVVKEALPYQEDVAFEEWKNISHLEDLLADLKQSLQHYAVHQHARVGMTYTLTGVLLASIVVFMNV